MIEAGAVVIVNCLAPKEKIWGVIVRLDSLGLVIRGLDLASVEDWLAQERGRAEALIGPSTSFIPMHRIERAYLDESSGVISGFADRYRDQCGRDVTEALLGTGSGAHQSPPTRDDKQAEGVGDACAEHRRPSVSEEVS